MAHKQTDIRNALASLLIGTAPDFATDAEDRVYKNRVHNLSSMKLPALLIHDGNETAIRRDTRSNIYIRTWSVRIEIVFEGNSDIDSSLDSIAQKIEDLINANLTLSGLAKGILYTGSETTFDGTAAKTIGIKTLNYNIQYIY